MTADTDTKRRNYKTDPVPPTVLQTVQEAGLPIDLFQVFAQVLSTANNIQHTEAAQEPRTLLNDLMHVAHFSAQVNVNAVERNVLTVDSERGKAGQVAMLAGLLSGKVDPHSLAEALDGQLASVASAFFLVGLVYSRTHPADVDKALADAEAELGLVRDA